MARGSLSRRERETRQRLRRRLRWPRCSAVGPPIDESLLRRAGATTLGRRPGGRGAGSLRLRPPRTCKRHELDSWPSRANPVSGPLSQPRSRPESHVGYVAARTATTLRPRQRIPAFASCLDSSSSRSTRRQHHGNRPRGPGWWVGRSAAPPKLSRGRWIQRGLAFYESLGPPRDDRTAARASDRVLASRGPSR